MMQNEVLMAQILILGAGLTGLSAAYHFEKKGFTDYLLVEKEDEIGGLCRSIYQDGFTFDYTGHLLHVSDPYFKNFIANTLGLENLTSIDRRSYIYLHDTFVAYPIQKNLFGLPTHVIVECLEEFVKRPSNNSLPKNYYQWVEIHFGKGLARHFFYPFQKKIFDYDLRRVTHHWTGRFVPSTSLTQMIEGAIENRGHESVGYNAHFYYPLSGGIASLIKSIALQVKQPILTNHKVKLIDTKKKIVYFSNGHSEPYEILISTMPLPELLNCIKSGPLDRLKATDRDLVCNSVVSFNLGIDRPDLSDKHWLYFPENQFPFYRLGFPHNFTKHAVPQGCSSLYGECAFTKKSRKYAKQVTEQAINKAKQFLGIKEQEVIMNHTITLPYAYVLYTHWREKNLAQVHKRLNDIKIHSIGRYGAWKYSSMQEAVLDGKSIADMLTMVGSYSLIREKNYIIPITQKREFEKQ